MPTFTYKGMSEAEVKRQLESYVASIKPPKTRGAEDPYRADKLDDDDVKEAAKKNWKEWVAERKKEYASGLKVEASKKMFQRADRKGGKHAKPKVLETVVFEKGKPVTLPASHWLVDKLVKLCTDGKYPASPHWEMKPDK